MAEGDPIVEDIHAGWLPKSVTFDYIGYTLGYTCVLGEIPSIGGGVRRARLLCARLRRGQEPVVGCDVGVCTSRGPIPSRIRAGVLRTHWWTIGHRRRRAPTSMGKECWQLSTKLLGFKK